MACPRLEMRSPPLPRNCHGLLNRPPRSCIFLETLQISTRAAHHPDFVSAARQSLPICDELDGKEANQDSQARDGRESVEDLSARAISNNHDDGEWHQGLSARAIFNNQDQGDGGESMSSSLLSMSSNSDDEDANSWSSSEALSDNRASPDQDEGPLNLISLRESLPAKRGLSRYFAGKSQSFSSLAEVYSVVDLAKPENPFVKRRKTGGDRLRNHLNSSNLARMCAPTSIVHHTQPDQPITMPFKSFSSLELRKASL